MKTRLFVFAVFWLLVFTSLYGQQQSSTMSAFAYIPSKAPDRYYAKFEEATTQIERLQYLDSLAQAYDLQDNPDSLAHYALRIVKVANQEGTQKNGAQEFLLKSNYFFGRGRYLEGLFDGALYYYLEGLSLHDERVDAKNADIQKIKLEVAQTYLQKGSFDKALDYLDEVAQTPVRRELKSLEQLYRAKYHILKKEKAEGLSQINRIVLTDTLLKDQKIGLEKSYLKAILYFNEQRNLEGMDTLITVKNQALTNGFYDLYIKSAIEEGKAHYRQNNPEVTEMAFGMAYSNTLQWNRLALQKNVLRAMRQFYILKEDYENAHNIMTQYLFANEQIQKKQDQRAAMELEARYETVKKEREILELQKEQLQKENELERQKTIKNALLIGFLIILVPIILLLVVYYQKLQAQSILNKQQEMLNKQEMRNLLQTQEMNLMKASVVAQQNERERIARQLHDQIGGDLAAVKLQLQHKENQKETAENMLQHLDKLYEQVREISHDLIPKDLQHSRFLDLVQEYLNNLQKSGDCTINFVTFPNKVLNQLEERLQLELFNTLKELVTNVYKHAAAQHIEVHLTAHETESTVTLLVEDDGKGFDLKSHSKGLGLNNLHDRVERWNGSVHIDSALQRGTVISVELPMKNSYEEVV